MLSIHKAKKKKKELEISPYIYLELYLLSSYKIIPLLLFNCRFLPLWDRATTLEKVKAWHVRKWACECSWVWNSSKYKKIIIDIQKILIDVYKLHTSTELLSLNIFLFYLSLCPSQGQRIFILLYLKILTKLRRQIIRT